MFIILGYLTKLSPNNSFRN